MPVTDCIFRSLSQHPLYVTTVHLCTTSQYCHFRSLKLTFGSQDHFWSLLNTVTKWRQTFIHFTTLQTHFLILSLFCHFVITLGHAHFVSLFIHFSSLYVERFQYFILASQLHFHQPKLAQSGLKYPLQRRNKKAISIFRAWKWSSGLQNAHDRRHTAHDQRRALRRCRATCISVLKCA